MRPVKVEPPAAQERDTVTPLGAYVLLVLCTLFWAGNAIAGKLAAGVISPAALSFYRWLLASLLLIPVAARHLQADARPLRAAAPRLFLMGAVGFAGFNFSLYHALHHTTALNVTIEQSCTPVLIVLGSYLLFRERVSGLQVLGIGLTITGVLLTATRGHPLSLLQAGLGRGDAIMLLGVLCYAGYTLSLRFRPVVHPTSLLLSLTLAATLACAVVFGHEVWRTGSCLPSGHGWALVGYTALLPSLASQLFYLRGVVLLGANRAGLFVNLVPVFGALLSVAILGETLRAYHVAGLALVLGGIAIAERFRPATTAS